MRQFQVTCELFGAAITALVLLPEQGLHVSVCGGELPHIGAVSVIGPDGVCRTVEFPGHRDSAVSSRWARQLWDAGFCPVVVEAGIHYDRLSQPGIQAVLSQTDAMLRDVQSALLEAAPEHIMME